MPNKVQIIASHAGGRRFESFISHLDKPPLRSFAKWRFCFSFPVALRETLKSARAPDLRGGLRNCCYAVMVESAALLFVAGCLLLVVCCLAYIIQRPATDNRQQSGGFNCHRVTAVRKSWLRRLADIRTRTGHSRGKRGAPVATAGRLRTAPAACAGPRRRRTCRPPESRSTGKSAARWTGPGRGT